MSDKKNVRIAYIAAGAAGMYCGSCIRDNSLVTAMHRQGHEVALIPTYTPLRTDQPGVAIDRVFFNGVSVYLQQKFTYFRSSGKFIDRLLGSRWVINKLAHANASTNAPDLGAMTISMLRGEEGPHKKEVDKLVDWLATDYRPHLVQITNSMLAGLAGEIKRRLDVPVLCALQGEDIFLEDLIEPYKREVLTLLRRKVKHFDGFITTSRYYTDFMSEYLELPAERIDCVPLGISLEGHGAGPAKNADQPFTIGYLARVCPEKGLHLLVEAAARLIANNPGMPIRIRAAGYLGKRDEPYMREVRRQAMRLNIADHFEYIGEVDRPDKIAFLNGLDVLSVPTPYRDPKGLFLLEAMANGVPVVQPAHGAFPELIEAAGGGLLVTPNDTAALADGLQRLLKDPALRRQLGAQGREQVHSAFSDAHMATATMAVYQKYLSRT